MEKDAQWQRLLSIARRITNEYPDAIFIGGVAVAVHAATVEPRFAEASHDIDLYLSLVGKSTMRDYYEMTPNPRLKKDVVMVDGEALDLYAERQHELAIPYDECAAFASEIDGIRVAALEHLLVLKVDAWMDPTRATSAKGRKDARDVARLILLLEHPNHALLDPYMSSARIRAIRRLAQLGVLREVQPNPHRRQRLQKRLEQRMRNITHMEHAPERDDGRGL